MIKKFCNLSDTCQEVREDHKQDEVECASCRPAAVYGVDFLPHHDALTCQHATLAGTKISKGPTGRNVFSVEIGEKQTVRKDKRVDKSETQSPMGTVIQEIMNLGQFVSRHDVLLENH